MSRRGPRSCPVTPRLGPCVDRECAGGPETDYNQAHHFDGPNYFIDHRHYGSANIRICRRSCLIVPLCELSLAVDALIYDARVTRAAFVFVSTTNPGPRAAVQAIRSMDGIIRVDALFGGPPVVVIVHGDNLLAIDAVIDRIVSCLW